MSLTVHAGHRAGIVGRNGVGKTTLFELLLGNLLPDDGDASYPKEWRVAILRQNIAPSRRSALDFVMDGDATLRNLERKITVAEKNQDTTDLVNLLSKYEDQGGYRYVQRAETILVGLGFTYQDFQKPHREFSGGWRIRLNLAQTLMVPSDLLLLDEPVTGIDAGAQIKFYDLLTNINKAGTSILWSSHDMNAVEEKANIVGCMKRNMIFHGSKADFFKNPDLIKEYTEAAMHLHSHNHTH